MSETARVVAEKPVSQEVDSVGNLLPITPEAIQENTATNISGELKNVGHPQEVKEVLAHGQPHTVLAKIDEGGFGADVVEVRHKAIRLLDNLTRVAKGTSDIYEVSGESGHNAVMGRASRIANFKKIPVRVKHALFGDKKAA